MINCNKLSITKKNPYWIKARSIAGIVGGGSGTFFAANTFLKSWITMELPPLPVFYGRNVTNVSEKRIEGNEVVKGIRNAPPPPYNRLRFAWFAKLFLVFCFACQDFLDDYTPPPPGHTFKNDATCMGLDYSITYFILTAYIYCVWLDFTAAL